MLKVKKDKKERSVLKSQIFLVLAIVLVIGAIVFFTVKNMELNKSKGQLYSKIESLKRETRVLEERNKELSSQISESSAESFVEKEARERLNLKKPGENVVVILPPKENPQKQEPVKNFWQRILNAFKLNKGY